MKKHQKASLLIAALLTASLLTACGNEGTEIMGFKDISAEGLSYDLLVPDEWISDISTGVTSAYYSNLDRTNISVTSFASTKDTSDVLKFWESYEPTLKSVFPDLEYEREGDETTLDGVPALQYVYTAKMADRSYKFMQIVSLYKGDFYIFTYTAEPDKYDTHWDDVKAILDYFDFTE